MAQGIKGENKKIRRGFKRLANQLALLVDFASRFSEVGIEEVVNLEFSQPRFKCRDTASPIAGYLQGWIDNNNLDG